MFSARRSHCHIKCRSSKQTNTYKRGTCMGWVGGDLILACLFISCGRNHWEAGKVAVLLCLCFPSGVSPRNSVCVLFCKMWKAQQSRWDQVQPEGETRMFQRNISVSWLWTGAFVKEAKRWLHPRVDSWAALGTLLLPFAYITISISFYSGSHFTNHSTGQKKSPNFQQNPSRQYHRNG